MLSAAGGVARSLVAAAVGAAGTVIGAAAGLLTGFATEESEGLLRGALVGAVTGALVSVDLADSLLRVWTCDVSAMDTRIKRTTFAAGRLLRGCAFPTTSGLGEHDDLYEPSSAVMAARRAVVESLPAATLTKETAAAWQQTTCPICLHEFQTGESARRLPACGHVFHLTCINSWLLWKPQCPMCRHAVY
ncbi:NEP1-interacting protein 2-like isoform X2 [Lolium perenne]|uniref:NEP1-interacting protein 2-like isoform X2 n=1 Tax=Lolium perenne TaxID=4522 RepID=UPI0021F68FE5|nr:NEP1-interacting protein 2-like isoform X4 [Lolium perenne]